MRAKRKLGGLMLLSVGAGMFVGMFIPGLGTLLAGVLIIIGFIYVFF